MSADLRSVAAEVVRFQVNGEEVVVGEDEVDVDTRLVTYLRDVLHLKGTKVSCGEGGCGACNVTVGLRDVNTGIATTRTVSSCLVKGLSCHGWDISTIEHLGNRKAGFHPLQTRLAKFHGTQCGRRAETNWKEYNNNLFCLVRFL